MPYLKCIGGPHDGLQYMVEDGRRDLIVQSIEPEAYVLDSSRQIIPAAVSATLERYTVRELRTNDFRGDRTFIRFLAPAEWSDEKAILHQFQ